MATKLITQPLTEPITAAVARLWCRIDDAVEDAILNILIKQARQQAEHRTGRKFITQTWELALDEFPVNEIKLPFSPVQEIVSVKYIDIAGVEQTIGNTNWTLDNYDIQHYLLLADTFEWPWTREAANAVKVQFKVGYIDEASMPAGVKLWIMAAVSFWYKNREGIVDVNFTQLPSDFCGSLLDEIWIPSL